MNQNILQLVPEFQDTYFKEVYETLTKRFKVR